GYDGILHANRQATSLYLRRNSTSSSPSIRQFRTCKSPKRPKHALLRLGSLDGTHVILSHLEKKRSRRRAPSRLREIFHSGCEAMTQFCPVLVVATFGIDDCFCFTASLPARHEHRGAVHESRGLVPLPPVRCFHGWHEFRT